MSKTVKRPVMIMAGGTGGGGVVIVAQYPGTVFSDVHAVGGVALFGGKIGDAVFGFFIDLHLRMVRSHMAFTASGG